MQYGWMRVGVTPCIVVLSALWFNACGGGSTQGASSFPPAATAGTVPVSVSCSAISAGSRKVSFGMPFPRGWLSDAAQVRLETTQGQEVKADVSELGRWRHVTDASIDGRSIRSVLITFSQECEASKSYDYIVRWGSTRTQFANAGITAANVSSTWGPQATPLPGEHPATDNYSRDAGAAAVMEPYAWVSLPADWLMKNNIRGPVSPITDPSMKTWLIGFNKTYVNDVNLDVTAYEVEGQSTGLIDWQTEVEGWLFDRPFALWNVYVQTGDAAWLRHAHRASQYYASWIAQDSSKPPYQRGAFRKKPPSYSTDPGDVKYSHAGGLFAAYLLTGDARLLDAIRAIADLASTQVSFRLFPYDKTSGLWTERHLAAGIAAYLYAYEATGDAAYKSKLSAIIDGMQTDVDSPPAGYPTAAQMAGVLLHRPEVHEGDAMPDMIMSPWMSALLCDVLMHYHLLSDDPRALRFMGNYAQFVADKGIYYGSAIQQHVPWYIAGLKAGYTDNGEWDDIQHTPDVLGLLARGRWARQQLNLPTDVLDTQITRLRTATSAAMQDAVRTTAGLPQYRASPSRRVGWWFGTDESLAWYGVQ
jgi:hypothetical protein